MQGIRAQLDMLNSKKSINNQQTADAASPYISVSSTAVIAATARYKTVSDSVQQKLDNGIATQADLDSLIKADLQFKSDVGILATLNNKYMTKKNKILPIKFKH